MKSKPRGPMSTPLASTMALDLSVQGKWKRSALLSGMGLSVMAAATWSDAALADAPRFGSAAYFAQRSGTTVPTTNANAVTGNLGQNVAGTVVNTPDQARVLAERSIGNLSRAVQAINSAQAAQSAARQLALTTPSNVPDGLGAGGLQVSASAALDVANPSACASTNTCSWQNAELPTQTTSGNATTVTVKQNADKAILTWDSFSIGQNTTLHFDQSSGTQRDGTNNWIALNRVSGSAAPSQIYGKILAEGSVYIINQNGILFAGSSQVNVHSLVASTLPLYLPTGASSLMVGDDASYLAYSNKLFLETGITSVGTDSASGRILGLDNATTLTAAQALSLPGDIKIQAGASIKTDNLGFSLIAAPNVENAGAIAATEGQVILAAGLGVTLNDSASGSKLLDATLTGRIFDGSTDVTPGSKLTNSGIIESPRGNITLLGNQIEQSGVLVSTSSVTRPGSIDIVAIDENGQRTGTVRMTGTSVTALLPDDNKETTISTDTATETFKLGSITLRGGSVRLENGALIEAPGQNVTISAVAQTDNGIRFAGSSGWIAGRIYIDDGAIVDVAGLADVQMSMADNLVTIARLGLNEFADSPLQRDGVLFGTGITVDSRRSGTRADGSTWVGTPLANVGGYVDQVPRGIQELLLNGGNIALAGGEVITRGGSTLNLDGGYLHYLGGVITTTRLIAANGAIIDIADADPNTTYIGLAGVHVLQQSRWNVTSQYVNPLLTGMGGYYESSYIEGGNAGTLQVYGNSSTVLNGTISAQAMSGRHQVADGDLATGGSFYAGQGSGNSLGSLVYDDPALTPAGPSYVVRDTVTQLDDGFNADSALADVQDEFTKTHSLSAWTQISGSDLADAGFSSVTLVADSPSQTGSALRTPEGGEILVENGSGFTVQPLGSIQLVGSRVTIEGDLVARAGSISVVATGHTNVAGSTLPTHADGTPVAGDINVATGVKLDTSGVWVNDAGLTEDQITGAATINGGSISLVTLQNSVARSGTVIETTGSINLSAGSLLDVSSGGRVLPNGALSQQANGVLDGRGGDIALQVYASNNGFLFGSDAVPLPTARPTQGELNLGGTLRGYGFTSGGTLSLRALGIQIGGSDETVGKGTLHLATDFFTQNGFGAYEISAIYDATIVDGAQVRLTQSNYIADREVLLGANVPTGSAQFLDHVSIDTLDDYRRDAVDFKLYAGDYLNWRRNGRVLDYSADGITGTLTLGKGAKLIGDARASITLGSVNQLTVYGSIVARGGDITLTGDTANSGYSQIPGVVNSTAYSSASDSIWIGRDAVLDVSGITLLDPEAGRATIDGQESRIRTGDVLDGGTVTLTNDTGYIITELGTGEGAKRPLINASGTQTQLDLPNTGDGTLSSQTVWSNGGTIRVGAGAGLYFDARLRADGGSDSAAGGTLIVTPLTGLLYSTNNGFRGAERLVVRTNPIALPEGAKTPGAQVESEISGNIYFATSVLENSGIDSLQLGVDPTLSESGPLPVILSSNVSIDMARSLVINASSLVGRPNINRLDANGQPIVDPSVIPLGDPLPSDVKLSAGYVAIHGYEPSARYGTMDRLGLANENVKLTVTAQSIDIGGQFSLDGFGTASFNSAGDIRFVTPAQYMYRLDDTGAATMIPGVLYTAGNLVFKADVIYPATGTTFIIDAVAPNRPTGTDDTSTEAPSTYDPYVTTVTFERNQGASRNKIPLSAGGNLLVDATHIEQSGILRAPSGHIVLGVSSTTDEIARALFSYSAISDGGQVITAQLPLRRTASVRLNNGSITSVSLGDSIIPYGATVDGQNWQYDGTANSAAQASSITNLTAPPDKQISINGNNILLAANATVDLSGGGDLQAQEWVPGVGGTRDVLSSTNTVYVGGTSQSRSLYSDGRAVYAVIPRYSGSVAAYDAALVSGDPLVGKSVYLSGIPGLPAGVYTLLPGQYATLPGAFRVVQDTSAIDTSASLNQRLADGTRLVSGYYVDSYTGARDARSTAFYVQSGSVWKQYSEYSLTSANTYFANLAELQGRVTPRLPVDAGQLVLAATNSLNIRTTLQAQAGEGGAGALVDIAATKIMLVPDIITGPNAPAGYVQLDVDQLNELGASSLLIGGIRTRTDDGDYVSVRATDVVVDTGRNASLSAPEVVLVADGNGGGVDVKANSHIEAVGSVAAGQSVNLIIGREGAGRNAVSGDGALLRVSNGESVSVIRNNLPPFVSYGRLNIGAGAQITAEGSVMLESAGNTVVDATAQFSAASIDAVSGLISFVGSAEAGKNLSGLVIGPETLAQFASAERINLVSRGRIEFVGNLDIDLDAALTLSAAALQGTGTVNLHAGEITLANTLNAGTSLLNTATGTLNLTANHVYFGDGELLASGFGAVSITGTQGLVASGKGIFDARIATLALHAPIFVASAGSDTLLRNASALSFDSVGAASADVSSGAGGAVAFDSASISIDSRIEAAAGRIDLNAVVGDIALGTASSLSVAGTAVTVHDVKQYASGGRIGLSAERGDITLAQGSVLDFSGAQGGGDAGALALDAAQGDVSLGASLRGSATSGRRGGSFSLDTAGAVDLDALSTLFNTGGVNGKLVIEAGAGNLNLSAGRSISADSISLSATGGAGGFADAQGHIAILGTLDVSGEKGGDIALFGRSGVDVQGSLIATGSSATERGGNVTLATTGSGNGTLNAQYGYQNVDAANSGRISIGDAARIDVSGGSSGGLSGGRVTLRAPLLANGDVGIDVSRSSTIAGAREVTLESYATWSTTDASTGAKHFDGIVDPAGSYGSNGRPAASTNNDHIGFYQTTLRDFVQQPGFAFEDRLGFISNLVVRPGIDLVSPNGDISVLTNWNLAAGTRNADGTLSLQYRYRNSIAPVLSLRAAGDLNIEASISDGFFQINNPLGGLVNNTASALPSQLATATLAGLTRDANGAITTVDSTSYRLVAGANVDSADPLAVLEDGGDVLIDGHTVIATSSRQIFLPTTIRTGTGSIDIAASGNVELLDTEAPAVIYTAGRLASGQSQATSSLVVTVRGAPTLIDTGSVNTEAAGSISITAGGDLIGVGEVLDEDGVRTGIRNANLSQTWWPWLERSCLLALRGGCGDYSTAAINFGAFNQGVMSIGGDVSVSAGGDISDFSVSLPTNWTRSNSTTTVYGGGDLSVTTGGDLINGSYFVAKGSGRFDIGGSVVAGRSDAAGSDMGVLLALQQSQLSLQAIGDVVIGGVYNPAYLFTDFNSQAYSSDSSLEVTSVSGDLRFNTASSRVLEYGRVSLTSAYPYVLPASLDLNALAGGISIESRGELYPSATGQLSIIARDDVRIFNQSGTGTYFGLIDASASLLPSSSNLTSLGTLRLSFIDSGADSEFELHVAGGLHAKDAEPVRIYSALGDIIDGNADYRNAVLIATNKETQIRAGRDIVNLSFRGQNLYDSDVTLISAGRDIYDRPLLALETVPVIEIGGYGAMVLQAGRNIGPITSANEALQLDYLVGLNPTYPGIYSVGNLYNAFLQRDGADISVVFGVGPGIATSEFANAYANPLAPAEGLPSYGESLIAFMNSYLSDKQSREGGSGPISLDAQQAWDAFQLLPDYQQQRYLYTVFFDILDRTGVDFNNPDAAGYQQFSRGYRAIETLFPHALGYTENSLSGGENGAEELVATGQFDMRGSTVQTQQGGNVSILGPGGDVLVGSVAAPPFVASNPPFSAGISPNTQGILALEQGAISIFADRSVLLAQSRIFTEQGGNVLIWSSNGDINAGQGVKTSTELPPVTYICDLDQFCLVDARSQVSGAGIAVLQTIPDGPSGNANLIAPRGTVDAGDAGIRVAGDINVAALRVANADNIQVQGSEAGVPTGLVDVGSVAAASSVAAAVQQSADSVAGANRQNETAASLITVEVLGFGSEGAP